MVWCLIKQGTCLHSVVFVNYMDFKFKAIHEKISILCFSLCKEVKLGD